MPERENSSNAPSRPDQTRIAAILAETPVLRAKVLIGRMTLAEVHRNLLSEQNKLIEDLEGAGVERTSITIECDILFLLGIPVVYCKVVLTSSDG